MLKVSGTTALVVADVALDNQRYNANDVDVTWETSSVRSWLNGYGKSSNQPGTDFSGKGFIDKAFSPEERSAIIQTNVINAKNTRWDTDGGNDTQDEAFLLSETEAYDTGYGFLSGYDTSDEARYCRTSDYAHAMGARRSTDVGYEGICYWWLRSPGYFVNSALFVYESGGVSRNGYIVDSVDRSAVRPALSLDLASSHPQVAGTVSSDGNVEAWGGRQITSVELSQTSYAYDGSAKTPGVTVTCGEKVLRPWCYEVVYTDNVDVGTATVTVTGEGSYMGVLTATFAIEPADLAKAKLDGVTARTYNGKAQTQSPTVVVGGRTLKNGTDYALSYKGNVNAGTATMTVTGRGNYSGTVTATFAIAPASLAKAEVANVKNRTYTGKAQTQSPAVKAGGRTLKSGTDYTLSYADNVNAGAAVVIVNGIGNYTGAVGKAFTIVKAKNPMKVKAVKRSAKASVTKKKARVVDSPIEFTKKAKGKVSYERVAKGSSKQLTVNKKTGKVTVKKGTVKGKYKVKIKVSAAGTSNYEKATKTLTCTIVVR